MHFGHLLNFHLCCRGSPPKGESDQGSFGNNNEHLYQPLSPIHESDQEATTTVKNSTTNHLLLEVQDLETSSSKETTLSVFLLQFISWIFLGLSFFCMLNVQSLFFFWILWLWYIRKQNWEMSKNAFYKWRKNSVFQPQMALRVPPAILDHLLDIRITSP